MDSIMSLLIVASTLFMGCFSYGLHHLSTDVTLPDNCKDLADGEYYFKLGDDSEFEDIQDSDYPIVKAKCSNGYLIIDVNYDSTMKDYFTSWAMWYSEIAGPTNSDIVDWDSWFIKSRVDPQSNKFLLSPDCSTCEENHVRQHFDTQTTYWMSGNLFGCYWMILGKHNCDLDKDTYSCYDCSESSDPQANGDAVEITEESDPSAYYFTGQCATAVLSSDTEVSSSHDTCQLGLHWEFGLIDGDDVEDEYSTNVVSKTGVINTSNRKLQGWNVDEFSGELFKPSIGTDGRFCVCSQTQQTKYYSVSSKSVESVMSILGDTIETFHQFSETISLSANIVDKVKIDENELKSPKKMISKTSENNIIKLYGKDFQDGTYRIKESGTYIIMEDIELDFNAGSLDDPQARGAWKPVSSQIEEYPGADTGRDEYFLGFFAGITIECDDVVLDLNSYSIGMSEVFFYQQRWFTVVSLTSQFFLPGNGPGFFGYDPKSGTNVVIKDGTIGLSSHFGIHGNYNKNVLIENVHVKGFEVHGIQFNGFENLNMKNVEVGPSTTQAYFTGEYGHMRYVIDRLNSAIDELDEDSVDDAVMNFYGRKAITLTELTNKLERMMNYAFDYVVKGSRMENTKSAHYQEYSDAIDIFVNPSGIPYASVLHGIFLNTKEASVMTYNLYTTTYSETATLENIKIHDLNHAMDERVRMYNGVYMFFGPFLNCLNARQLLGDHVVDNDNGKYMGVPDEPGQQIPYNYHGSIVTDVYLALKKYSNNWDYLEKMLTVRQILVPWAEGETSLPPGTNIACNMDVMIHSGKGTTGLRLDGVKDVTVNNLEVYNLHDSTPSGETVCGEYENFQPDSGGGHLAQQLPMQQGFSGNKVQAVTFNSAYGIEMNDIRIYNLESDTGPVTGLAVWPANEINFGGEIMFDNFQSSTKLDKTDEDSDGMSSPNFDHFSCAVFVYESYYKESADTTYTIDVALNNDHKVASCGINSDNWESDCYKFSDETGDVYDGIDSSSSLYSFIKKANSQESECGGSTHLGEHGSVVGAGVHHNEDMHSSSSSIINPNNNNNETLMWGGIILISLILLIVPCMCAYKYFGVCQKKKNDQLTSTSARGGHSSNYGTI